MKFKNQRKICIILLIVFIFLIYSINFTSYIYNNFSDNQERIKQNSVNETETLVTSTVREQQVHMLSSLKQSWVKYLEKNYDENLIEKDIDGFPIYSNSQIKIGFNSNTMYKVQSGEINTYNIFSKQDNSLIASLVKPQWNSSKVEEVLDILVAPLKIFGNNGGIIVFDSNTGEIFLDSTPNNRISSKTEVSIFDDATNKNNKNPEETQLVIDKYFKQKRDSNRNSSIVYLFNEDSLMGEDASNFTKYPLGDYNRQFIEMSVLPYETIGFDGQPMQLTILSVADEQDIFSSYTELRTEQLNLINDNNKLYSKIAFVLVMGVVIIMVSMISALYVLKQNDK